MNSIEMRLKALEEMVYGTDNIPKIKPKKINLSVLISSGIDCEFADHQDFDCNYLLGRLKRIGEFGYSSRTEINSYCRPRFNHIHASPKGWDKCPIPEGFNITAWRRDGVKCFVGHLTWGKCKDPSNTITMFEITGIQEGYEL